MAKDIERKRLERDLLSLSFPFIVFIESQQALSLCLFLSPFLSLFCCLVEEGEETEVFLVERTTD